MPVPSTAPSTASPGLTPPVITECVVGALIPDHALREAVLGDLAEEFTERYAQHGVARAWRWYRGQTARAKQSFAVSRSGRPSAH